MSESALAKKQLVEAIDVMEKESAGGSYQETIGGLALQELHKVEIVKDGQVVARAALFETSTGLLLRNIDPKQHEQRHSKIMLPLLPHLAFFKGAEVRCGSQNLAERLKAAGYPAVVAS